MTPEAWPRRLPMAVAQLRRGALEAPWPQASWSSVARRSVVVVAFVTAGLVTGHLNVFVFAAFGALQLGLGEAILPFRRLVRLVMVSTATMCAVAFVALVLSGTWWTVPFLAAVAFVQSATVSVGVVARTVGIGALAMGVIFAGIGADPVLATTWLAIGAVVQALVWLIFWHRERALSLRVALANTIRTMELMVRSLRVSGRDGNRASAEIDEVLRTIDESGVPNRSSALDVAAAVTEVRRTLIAWRVLEMPGYGERLAVIRRLHLAAQRLGEGRSPTPDPSIDLGHSWPVGDRLITDLANLDHTIDRLGTKDDRPEPVHPPPAIGWEWLRPGNSQFRQGLRMAVAIGIAQSLSLLAPLNHSFWIPLTCVFVVKPEWSFTIVRSTARIGGNLLAVVLVPLALQLAAGQSWALAVVVAVISAVAFRYFTGNYILASFGVAGTILVLDQTVSPDQALYVSRIVATLIGAAVGIAVSALVPTFRSRQARALLADVVRGLGEWSARVTDAVARPGTLNDAELIQIGEHERNNLLRLRPTAEASLLEPKPVVDPRCLAVSLDAAERAHLCLLALTFQARHQGLRGGPGLDVAADAEQAGREFRRAAEALGVDPPPAPLPAPASPPTTDEERAVALQAVRLRQAAVDLADAAEWLVADRR